jgi:hypothetical protein
MVTPSRPSHSSLRRPPAWQRWAVKATRRADAVLIAEWASLMADHLQRPDGATAMRTKEYTVDVTSYVRRLISATAALASHGNPVARSLLADAALDLKSALDRLYDARDELLKSADAERVIHDD